MPVQMNVKIMNIPIARNVQKLVETAFKPAKNTWPNFYQLILKLKHPYCNNPKPGIFRVFLEHQPDETYLYYQRNDL